MSAGNLPDVPAHTQADAKGATERYNFSPLTTTYSMTSMAAGSPGTQSALNSGIYLAAPCFHRTHSNEAEEISSLHLTVPCISSIARIEHIRKRGSVFNQRDQWDSFFTAPALSFSAQPALKDLFELVAATDTPVTLVLGAGVSRDAALPTWEGLIRRLVGLLPEEEQKRWKLPIEEAPEDLTRKAETLVAMVQEVTPKTAEGAITEALYGQGRRDRPEPGPLADALARLVLQLGPSRCQVLTTNFDTLLEQALQSLEPEVKIQSRSLNELEGPEDPEAISVLHLHGILEPNERGRGPVVLTESDFLTHGPAARAKVLEHLKRRCVIFVGVSLTDPNLVGPLWDAKRERESRQAPQSALIPQADEDFSNMPYAVTVAAASADSSDPANSAAYVIRRSTYLSKTLRLNSVFVKSYSQVPQLFYELALADHDWSRYFEVEADQSIRYGFRLKDSLDSAYLNLGCSATEDLPVGEAAVALQKTLHGALYGPKGIAAGLVDLREQMRHTDDPSLKERWRLNQEALLDEHYGLFLYLRSRADAGRQSEYLLKLMGTSAYVHHEGWSMDRTCQVSADSRHVAGQAAFRGQAVSKEFEQRDGWQLWRSCIAVPFAIASDLEVDGTVLKAVQSIGVITLNSTKSHQPGTSSLLPLLQPSIRQQLESALQKVAQTAVSRSWQDMDF